MASRVVYISVLFYLVVGGRAVTPVAKVIELLKRLSVQVTEEGKMEAASYDKYACFCKEQADNKIYAIEKSTERIAILNAKLSNLDADLQTLTSDISTLVGDINQHATDIDKATKNHQAYHDDFLLKQADAVAAISACDRALAALKESKGSFDGKAELNAALLELRNFAGSVGVLLDSRLEKGFTTMGGKSLRQPGQAYESGYHSNEIILTIEGLREQFIGIKNSVERDEFEMRSMFEKRVLALTNEKMFMEQEKAEKEALSAKKTEERSRTDTEKTEETAAKDADDAFMQVMKTDCESKANLFDQCSNTRSAELTAISQALEILETGASPNWGANRKLAEVQRHVVLPPRPLGFLQIGRVASTPGDGHMVATKKVLALLSSAAQRFGSPALAATALKVQVSEDHFVKVRQLIKDLVEKLEMDKKNEATTKSYCDQQMGDSLKMRDEQKVKLEDLAAQISGKTSTAQQLRADIAQLSEELAQNAKALNEATQLRQTEKATNTKTIADAGVGREAVEQALSILRKFYQEQGAGLLQQGSTYVPPNSDRAGKTVADLAPEIFDEKYEGKQEESKGIIGLLEVMLTDFERTESTVASEEDTSGKDFEDLSSDLNTDSEAKSAERTTKTGELETVEDDLVTLEGERKASQELLDAASKSLETLQKMCVAGEESYEERVAKRNQEIEALKEAIEILDNWKN